MKKKLTKHHIIPTSRKKGKGIQGVCMVEGKLHELYHHLFGNMTPEEIINWLNETYWKNCYEITIKERRQK